MEVIVFLLALNPPELLIFLNLFSFGGLEAAFIWPIVLGLYWKYGNKYGAIASMITGMVSYIALHFYNEAYGNLFGVHTVTIPVVLSLIAYVVFSLLINKTKIYILIEGDPQMNHWKIYAILTTAMFIWGFNLPLLKYLLTEVGPVTMTAFRLLLAGISVFIILAVIKLIRLPTRKEWLYVIGGRTIKRRLSSLFP